MKNLILSALTILFTTLVITAIPTDAEAKIYEDTLRLHILANSNTEEDQALKLEIRDLLLSKYGADLKSSRNTSDAIYAAESMVSDMEKDVNAWLIERGYSYSVKVTLTDEWYDTREYEDYALPSGIYTSLRVIIGKGEGKNWWCVMYPPMCLDLACESAPADNGLIDYTQEEITLIKGGEYKVKFKVLEILSNAFAKNG